jgi:hypothetical protein
MLTFGLIKLVFEVWSVSFNLEIQKLAEKTLRI